MTESSSLPVPHHFVCPLTLQIMKRPLLNTKTGHSYERSAILDWMYYGRDAERHKAATCPLTRVPLRPTQFIFNTSLQDEIEEWKLQHGMSLHDDDDEEESGVNASLEEEEEDNDETSTEHPSHKIEELVANQQHHPQWMSFVY